MKVRRMRTQQVAQQVQLNVPLATNTAKSQGMKTQQSVPSLQQPKNNTFRRVLLIGAGILVILIGIIASILLWHISYDLSNNTFELRDLLTLAFVTLPLTVLGMVLIMLNVIFKPTLPPHRFWPGGIACFCAAMSLASRAILAFPFFWQNIVPGITGMTFLFLYIIGSVFAMAIGAVALRLTQGFEWEQGRLLAHLGFWLGFLLTFLICVPYHLYV